MLSRIEIFRGQYSFLSNFFIEPDGTHVEGEYQASKCAIPADRALFIGLTPAQAKRVGRKVKLQDFWDSLKTRVMFDLVMTKFTDHENLREQLLATGDAELVESNNWHDLFWGRCTCSIHNGVGENRLGRILMGVRARLRG